MRPTNEQILTLYLAGFTEDPDPLDILQGILFIKNEITIQAIHTSDDKLIWSVDTFYNYLNKTRPTCENYTAKNLNDALDNAHKLWLHQQELTNETSKIQNS